MTWDHNRAAARIQKELADAPMIETQRYSDQYMPSYRAKKMLVEETGGKATPPLVNLKKGTAVLVDTVQIYINLINLTDYLLVDGDETEESHERALEFLHFYYSACDRVIEQSDAQRVDFHGGRLHMVILDESGNGISKDAIARALLLVNRFQAVAEKANKELGKDGFPVSLRVGIDTGICVAINNGTGNEQEPMFLGSAANHAARLAEGDSDGIFVSDRIRNKLSFPEVGHLERFVELDNASIRTTLEKNMSTNIGGFRADNVDGFATNIIEGWQRDIISNKELIATTVDFKFFYKTPPLSDIDFADLMPSRTARMPLASLFADISGYTAYIDSCIRAGDIANAVRALYVIRSEFQNVVEKDFKGRKIRFIGDCVHAVLADGDDTETNHTKTVFSSIECAGGLRSSFNICLDEIGNLNGLGLAIGLELGITPISRLGIRGERSVRVATSSTTAAAETLQSACDENQTRLGSNAIKFAPLGLSDLFDINGVSLMPIDYDDVAGGVQSPMIISTSSEDRAHTPSSTETPRAHSTFQ